MRISQIKQRLSLEDVLSYFGHEPDAHTQAHDKWFKSPFRSEETKASFHINTRKDIWFDHGEGKGGDLIDFAKAYNSKTLGKDGSIREALALLREIIGDKRISLNKKSTGLGLAIVKRILEIHDCTIQLTSNIGQGTTFSFCLPHYNKA